MTLRSVTKELRKASGDPKVELVRGRGYFYFSGGVADRFFSQSVYVYRLRSLSVEQWVEQLMIKIKEL